MTGYARGTGKYDRALRFLLLCYGQIFFFGVDMVSLRGKIVRKVLQSGSVCIDMVNQSTSCYILNN